MIDIYPLFCPVSGCTPGIVHSVRDWHENDEEQELGPLVECAMDILSDEHEYSSQNNLSVIGPIYPSGQPFAAGMQDGLIPPDDESEDEDEELPGPPPSDICPEKDIRVVRWCFIGDFGYLHGPQLKDSDNSWNYFVARGSSLMVQTYALDIMTLATRGRMTPLRLWRLAMAQGFYSTSCMGFDDVRYGEIKRLWGDCPEPFPGMGFEEWDDLEGLGDAKLVKQRLVHECKFWLWMAPDRFPISSTEDDPPAPTLPEPRSCTSHPSAFEGLPLDVLTSVISILPLASLINLTSTSRFLRRVIFGNDHLARDWLAMSAHWWIPASTGVLDNHGCYLFSPYLASQLTPDGRKCDFEGQFQNSIVGLDWAYIRRCVQPGSMQNRRRIWETILDIERVADQTGV